MLIKLSTTLFNTTFSKVFTSTKVRISLHDIFSVYIVFFIIVKFFLTSTSSKSTLQISAAICASLAGGEKRKEYNFMISRQARYIWKSLNFCGLRWDLFFCLSEVEGAQHHLTNRNQNSESYNQICASVSCSTAKHSTDRVKKEHVYWMTWEIMQGSSPEFCLDQWAWYKSSFKFGLSVMNFRRTHWQVTSSVYCCRLFHMDTQ